MAARHNVNVLLVRVAVKHCFKLLNFFTFIFAVLLQSADSIKYICVLNTVVFSDHDFL